MLPVTIEDFSFPIEIKRRRYLQVNLEQSSLCQTEGLSRRTLTLRANALYQEITNFGLRY